MGTLFDVLLNIKGYNNLVNQVNEESFPVCITGFWGAQKAFLMYAMSLHMKKPGLIITYNELEAKKISDELKKYNDNIFLFENREMLYYDIEAYSHETEHSRIRTINNLINNDSCIVVSSIQAILKKIVPKQFFAENIFNIVLGQFYEIDRIAEKLVALGYERVDMVEGMGQFSIRGGIIDIFSINSSQPYRIEFFDDEVDSIRVFDISSQRSIEKKHEISVIPAKEIIFNNTLRKKMIKKIDSLIIEAKEQANQFSDKLLKVLKSDKEKLINQNSFASIDKYISYIFSEYSKTECSLLNYFNNDTLIIIDEATKMEEESIIRSNQLNEYFKDLLQKGLVTSKMYNNYLSYEEIIEKTKDFTQVSINNIQTKSNFINYNKILNITSKTINDYSENFNNYIDDIKVWKNKNYNIVFGSNNKAKKIIEQITENGFSYSILKDIHNDISQGINVLNLSLINSFEIPEANLVLVCEKEKKIKNKPTGKKNVLKPQGTQIEAFADLNIGDYVVHETHGIGIYKGLENIIVDDVIKEYAKIKYQRQDYLYVPVNQLKLVQKYIGSEAKAPKLNKLGSNDWNKIKSKVKSSVKELAIKLNELYAVRNTIKGHAFSKDTLWQLQFEDNFPYEETPDQIRCIREVKKDMENIKPMDRLLCGDVGYGKTEVAIRGAFKAVMDQKQVAYLVPTTILAQQHYNTFSDRMKDFPINVEVLSRFKTPKEQKEIIKRVKTGEVDILIGTHRILQKDIKFRDLGFLIIDEEQRFGVAHKEILKTIAKNIDVLSMTATPIPRTLHMSMIGVRDMSLLTDPPEGRSPVQTYVLEYNEFIIIESITKELARGGQVFYLYNRVNRIDNVASIIRDLVPDAKVAVAHGQMSEKALENIMIKVLNKEIDVLVCTTIIESGLDITNVNTLLIEDADNLGLSQLYQLRGRVGRTNKTAYAYLMYQKNKILDSNAEKRLSAIKEYTEFGSGFKIAMRDLEIRGAGNILGPEQHGHMEAVGYDTYCKLLDEAVKEIKGEKVEEKIDTTVEFNIDAYIPEKYINNEKHRFDTYKKISSIDDDNAYYNVQEEIEDIYGDVPKSVDNLMKIAMIKNIASELNIEVIKQHKKEVIITFAMLDNMYMEKIFHTIDNYKDKVSFTASAKPYITYKVNETNNTLLNNIKIILQNIKEIQF